MQRMVLLILCFLTLSVNELSAQCAMCRSTLENNFSNGNPSIASGINTGILYLLVLPYLAILILGYCWYKSSKNARKELFSRTASR
jgi:hypothetical protein